MTTQTATQPKSRWTPPSARFLTLYDSMIVENVRESVRKAGNSVIADDIAELVVEAILKAKETVAL